MNDEVKEFLDTVIVECLNHSHCVTCPYESLLNGECVWQLPPYLWNTDEMKEMIERINNG